MGSSTTASVARSSGRVVEDPSHESSKFVEIVIFAFKVMKVLVAATFDGYHVPSDTKDGGVFETVGSSLKTIPSATDEVNVNSHSRVPDSPCTTT